MHKQLTEISHIHNNLRKYWPQFTTSPYAYYDRETVSLYHHPHFKDAAVTLPWSSQFTGCTSILFENEVTAIVDISHLREEEIYAILIHELFHCHQFHKKENRFPNELAGIAYPLENENIKWRIAEREYLNEAIRTEDINEQKNAIQAFIYWREKRRTQYNEFVQYEQAVETIEGPAFFIEYHAYKDRANLPEPQVFERYLQPLTDYSLMVNKVRQSCYTSGLAICLLLEKLSPNWKEDLFNHQLSIYEVLKKLFLPFNYTSENTPNKVPIKALIQEAEANKHNEIKAFTDTNGFLLTITGKARIKQFDPMNITKWHEFFLHKKGMTIWLQGQSVYFSQPVLAVTNQGLNDVIELQFIVDNLPTITENGMNIENIGQFQGELNQDGKYLYFQLAPTNESP